MPSDDPDLTRVEDIFAGLTVADEPLRRGPAVLIRNLVDLLRTGQALSVDQQKLLFRDSHLRGVFSRLKEALAAERGSGAREQASEAAAPRARPAFSVPVLAAAATKEEISERTFHGGSARVIPSRIQGQVYVVIALDGREAPPDRLQMQRLNCQEGRFEVAVVDLEFPAGTTVARLIRPAGDLFVKLIKSPDAEGLFLDLKRTIAPEPPR